MYIKLNYINVFKKCIEKLQYMYIVRHRTTWDGTIKTLGLVLQSYSTAHGPKLFILK